jgi:hypothetical protein
MPRTNPTRRQVEAFESIARSSARLAQSFETIAALERERVTWLRAWLGRFRREGRDAAPSPPRRYGADGGLRSGVDLPPPIAPRGPGGTGALLTGERLCINVTPEPLRQTRE